MDDKPALVSASAEGPVGALFVIDPARYDKCSRRRRDLLVAGLADLDRSIKECGGHLRVEHGILPLSYRKWQRRHHLQDSHPLLFEVG